VFESKDERWCFKVREIFMMEDMAEKKRSKFGGGFWIGLAIIILVGLILLPNFVRVRTVSSVSSCINNLRQIDGAKQTWGLEHHAPSNAVPTWQDIQPYMVRGTASTLPTCPQGGHYIIGSLQVAPTCSIPRHKLDD
jgi:hypothetical protein